jgi:hypothetical protein
MSMALTNSSGSMGSLVTRAGLFELITEVGGHIPARLRLEKIV